MSDIVHPFDASFQEILCLPDKRASADGPTGSELFGLSITIGSGAVAVIGKPLVSRLDEMIC
jgi:hypothetical protein